VPIYALCKIKIIIIIITFADGEEELERMVRKVKEYWGN
jgi:hypothetical protein